MLLTLLLFATAPALFGQANPLVPYGKNTYVTGITVIASARHPSCPLFVWVVDEHSPASKLDIKPGDRLLAVNGQSVSTVEQAGPLLRTDNDQPATLLLGRGSKTFSMAVPRLKLSELKEKDGMKVMADGSLEPLDATDAEIKYDLELENHFSERLAGRVFPSHYPDDSQLYYAGFEIFILKNPTAIAVGGLEHGPARDAGIHWGDVITSVNGIDPRGKSVAQLQSLFSRNKPEHTTLLINRMDTTKTLYFTLARAIDILHRNHRQLYKGKIVPDGVPPEYLYCED